MMLGMTLVFLLLTACSAEEDRCPESCTCTDGILTCENTKFPGISEISRGIYYVRYYHVELWNLTAEIFKTLAELETLKLQHCNIQCIEGDVFQNNLKLICIDLSYNNLESIPSNIFKGLKYLTELNLSYNNLEYIPFNIFEGRRYTLNTIQLSNNKLLSLPENLLNGLRFLYIINLSHNKLSNIPGNLFYSNKSLREIEITDNELRSFNISLLKNNKVIYYINLENNKLSDIQGFKYVRFKRLYNLHLSGNMLTSLPEDLGTALPELESLYMERNLISDVSNKIFNVPKGFSKLIHLNIAVNNISEINSTTFTNLHYLEHLNLSSNNIFSISACALKSLSSLRNLDLSHNFVNNVPDGLFDNSLKLEYIDLSYNCLTALNGNILSKLYYLKVLNIQNNPFAYIDSETFSGLKSLKALDISRTYVFNAIHFRYLNVLQWLKMINCNISCKNFLLLDVLSEVSSIKQIILNDNPLCVDQSRKMLRTVFFPNYGVEVSCYNSADIKIKQACPVKISKLVSCDDTVTFTCHSNCECYFNIEDMLSNESHLSKQIFNYTTVRCVDYFFPYMPENTDPNILVLIIHGKVKTIEENYFENMLKLQTLNLSRNKIESLPPKIFHPLKDLQILDLSHNNIKYIYPTQFQNLKYLCNLSLDNNPIRSFNSVQLDLSKLETLTLSHNELDFFDIMQAPKLTGLYLGNEKVSHLHSNEPDALNKSHMYNISRNIYRSPTSQNFGNFSIKILKLECNTISTINEDMFQNFLNLEELDLSHNSIDELPCGFLNNSKKLKNLRVSNNKLKTVLKCHISGLINLTELDLSCNMLETIDNDAFKKLNTIDYIDLTSNHLSNFPKGITEGCKNLRELYISNNPLKMKIEYLKRLTKLEKLDLRNTSLQLSDSDTFQYMKNLILLNLSHNKVRSITEVTFPNLSFLRYLILSHNNISYVHGNAFVGLEMLETIDLSNNDIKKLDDSVFKHTVFSLNIIDLSCNFIDYISPYLLAYVLDLKHLNLSFNNFKHFDIIALKHKFRNELLDLSNNEIKAVEYSVPKSVLFGYETSTKIICLNLSFNNIQTLNYSIFKDIFGLQTLDLSHNIIDYIPQDILLDVSSLKHLNLSFNNVQHLDISAFNENIEYLDLSNNKLKVLYCTSQSMYLSPLIAFEKENFLKIVHEEVGHILILRDNPMLYHTISLYKNIHYVTELDLENTGLSAKSLSVLDTIFMLPNLKTLKINRNPICKLPGLSYINVLFNLENTVQTN